MHELIEDILNNSNKFSIKKDNNRLNIIGYENREFYGFTNTLVPIIIGFIDLIDNKLFIYNSHKNKFNNISDTRIKETEYIPKEIVELIKLKYV